MEEQLISFETAKLAKEKGFDEKVYREYDKSGYLRCTSKSANVVLGPYDELLKSTEYPAPTQSLLQKWLREEHNSIVEVVYSKQDYTSPIKFESTVDYFTKELEYEITIDPEFSSEKFLKYEDALEIGLFNALKLIN